MHKELNAVKGGNTAMMAFWAQNGLQPPIKLYNCDNEAVALGGTSAAQKRAQDVSQAGAMKMTSLAGAIFKHKDDKKGQHDTFCAFFLEHLGYPILFPDTSNTHCEAASVLLVYHPLFLQFLELIRDKKDSGLFNHMEKNVYVALQDGPTITELCSRPLFSNYQSPLSASSSWNPMS
jgi:hypothetical protein